jgi:peptidoglycan hydrolase-like protein with peptidoglycan-binding domain
MNNEFVKQLQAKLKLTIDGIFGPETEATVRVFQRDHDLVPDGIVGPKTWRELDKL